MAARGDFAALLRAWRDRVQPTAVGLPAGRRKTSGLRREEVAMLAGLSVDYVIRLEQGRAQRPSEQVVAALARVLQLSDLSATSSSSRRGCPPRSRRSSRRSFRAACSDCWRACRMSPSPPTPRTART